MKNQRDKRVTAT